jgi:hypothetical protein
MPDSCNDVSVTAPLMVQELAALSLQGKQGGQGGTAVVADATCKVRTADISADGQRKVSWRAGLGGRRLGGIGLSPVGLVL